MLPGAPHIPSPAVTPCYDHPVFPAVITPVLLQGDGLRGPPCSPARQLYILDGSSVCTAPRQAASPCWMCEEAPEETLDTQLNWNLR